MLALHMAWHMAQRIALHVTNHFSSHDFLKPWNAAGLKASKAARTVAALLDSLRQLDSIFQALVHALPCSISSTALFAPIQADLICLLPSTVKGPGAVL